MTAPVSTVDGIAPDPPGRPDRRWTALRRMSALALVALVAAIVVPGLLPADTADPADGVVLPASIAVNAPFPSSVESYPVGSALLLFRAATGSRMAHGTACTLDASLQVATNLLSRMEVRPAKRADWGPVSLRWSLGGTVVLVWLAAVIYIRRGRTFGPPSAGRA